MDAGAPTTSVAPRRGGGGVATGGSAGGRRPAHLPHVQGLRAVAVVLVVACHARLAAPGGFVGVDVFFVISGFVISRELLAELGRTGTVRLGAFAARRARRLLPALALVTVATTAGTVLVLNPFAGQVAALRTALASTFFVGNASLYRHVGYFDASADSGNPFLHLWSLAVEEQVYLLLPTTLLVGWRLAGQRGATAAAVRRRLLVAVAAGGAASLALSWAFVADRAPLAVEAPARFAFYAPPTRAWEFAVGIVLALVERRAARLRPPVAAVLGGLGLLLVGWTALTLDPLAPFPGLAAVPPVLGAGLLLAAGTGSGRGAVVRALELAPVRWVGDRSYEWYLWHWPAIVLGRAALPGWGWVPAVAALGALVPAAATHRAFDRRIRRNPALVGRRVLVLVVTCLAVPGLVLAGAGRGVDRGWGLEEPVGWYDYPEGRNVGCLLFNRDLANRWREDACTARVPDAEGLVLVLGDAWADSVVPGLRSALADRPLDVAEWARSGCPLLGRAPVGYPRCTEWQRDALALVDRLDPVLVVVANRSPDYTADPDGATPIATDGGGRAGSAAVADRLWGEGLDELLTALDRRAVPALVVAAGPDYGERFPRRLLSLLRPDPPVPTLSLAAVDHQRGGVLAVERTVVARHPSARLVDPVPALCAAECRPVRDGRWLHHESQDLTIQGSLLLAPALRAAALELLGGG